MVVSCSFLNSKHTITEENQSSPASSSVICRVNELSLTQEQFNTVWQEYLTDNRITDETVLTIARQQLLEQMVDRMLLIAYAREQGYDICPDFLDILHNLEEQALIDYTLARTIYSDIVVSDDEITSYYINNLEDYTIPARVQVRHILARTRDEVESALVRIRNGEDFAQVARTVSIHSSAGSGGVLPRFSRGTYDKDFEETAFKLKVGEISAIVKSNLGYHIIEKISESPEQFLPIDTLRDEITKHIIEQKRKKQYIQFLEQIKQTITVEYYE